MMATSYEKTEGHGPVHRLKSDARLDVSEVLMPFSLAMCKASLSHLDSGAVLQIRLSDYDTLQDLLIIVKRCGDEILAWEKHRDNYFLWVRKSPESR